MRRLIVEDFTCGTVRSTDINTNIPFEENFAKADTIQRANAVIAAYTNANYNELQNYNRAVEEIREEVEGFSETKQDTLTAGNNIIITDENVISSVNTTYTAGTNVSISEENVISATDTTYTAGTGIEITEGNVINNTQSGAVWGNITGTLSEQTDLNNVLTGLSNDISGKQDTIDDDNKLPYSYLSGTPTIPTPLTVTSNTDDNPYSCNYINGDVLYEDSGTGVNTDITLNANASLYKYFDIYYRNNDSVYGIAKVPYTTGYTFIATFAATGSDIVVKTATISFSGTTLQRVYTREKGMNSTGQTNANNYIYIMKVVGHK